MGIRDNYLRLIKEIPEYVKVVLAAKTRTVEEIREAVLAGAEIIGENYVQEAGKMYNALGRDAVKIKWHMIGSLQKNKINKALNVFDCIQTIDSIETADALNKRAQNYKKKTPVFIEINIGSEITKSGVRPEYEYVERLAGYISGQSALTLEGLMTMGPRTGSMESIIPYFKKAKGIFERLKNADIPNIDLKYLSMGMSNSYKAAIEAGANMIRIGTAVFGKRSCDINT